MTGREDHIEVPRTARYHVLEPEEEGNADDVWFVLHGYRQLAERFLRRFTGLLGARRMVVAPEGLSRFYVEREVSRHGPESVVGASWMTRDDREREITDYVRYLDRLADRILDDIQGSPAVTVLGFSQGAATAARWAVLGSRVPDRLVLWADTLPPDLPGDRARERLREIELVSVVGDTDPTRRDAAERDERRRLSEWGIERRLLTHPGGHEIEADVLRELAHTP